jgi:hypothetical protein
MSFIVYKTTNLINGREYIGKHYQESDPFIFDGYLGSGTAIKSAIQKYGKTNFKRETLFVFESEEDAYKKEFELVNENTYNNLYNLKDGGKGGHYGFIYVFSKIENRYCLIRKKDFNNNFEKAIDSRKTKVKNKIHIQNIITKKIIRWSKDKDIPNEYIRWSQHIGNKNKKMCFNKETKEVRYLDQPDNNFVIGHPNGGITAGMRYINNGKKISLIDKEEKIPDGWFAGRGRHKNCDYIWCHNPISMVETKVPCEFSIPEGFTAGRASSIIIWIENDCIKSFRKFRAREKIPPGWKKTDKSSYVRKKLIKNKEYFLYEEKES